MIHIITDLSEKEKRLMLSGGEDFKGLISYLENKYQETKSSFVKQEIEKTMRSSLCPLCQGARLKPESLAVKIDNLNIFEICQLSIEKLQKLISSWLSDVKQFKEQAVILEPIAKEINKNLKYV